MNKIDFVIPWVDGNDQEWIKCKSIYEKECQKNIDNSEHRYRDWDNLKYWFRGVEKYAPWVNKVYFITWGHVPSWLNLSHPKLVIVKHDEYIPNNFLPTFSANPIELNLHRIKGLEEQFVYFNDDTFIINPLKKEDFFKNGKPCDSAILNVHCYDFKKMYILTPFIDIAVINKYFKLSDVIKNNKCKWFSLKYGKYLFLNIFLQFCPRFPGILQKHLPNAFLKSTFYEVWDKESDLLTNTCTNRFRHILDANQWLMKEWQIASGNFEPRKVDIGKSMYAKDFSDVIDYINNSTAKFICINDSEMNDKMFIEAKQKINFTLNMKFPNQSSFENGE